MAKIRYWPKAGICIAAATGQSIKGRKMRVVLTLLLLLAAGPACSGWVKVAGTDRAVHYIDPATIRNEGSLRRVREISDLKQKGPKGQMSMQGVWEHNCVEGKYRGLSLTLHSEPMAGGQIIESVNTPTKWDYIASNVFPKTPSEVIHKIVCADSVRGHGMIEYGVILLAQAIGVLLWSFLNAGVLLWRAHKLKGWVIRYKDTYVISLKAGFIGLAFGDTAVLTFAFAGGTSADLFKVVGCLFGVVAWWFAHSSALLKLAGTSTPLTVKDARAISASVLGYLVILGLVVGFGALLVAAVVGVMK